MASDARKKEKQRLKRKQKQQQARKAAALSPLERIAKSGGQLECYVNDDWAENGMANVQVLGQAPGGQLAHAAFLIDVWCVGLKDAYGHRQVLRSEFDDHLDRMNEQLDMVRIPDAEAKRLVAGGIQFARRNGFRLPAHHDRWVSIFGKLSDAEVDLTDFGIDGGLRYIGTEQFLRQRLTACTAEEFLARPDVQWVMGDGMARDVTELVGESFDDDAEGDEDEEGADFGGLDLSDQPMINELALMLEDVADRAEDAVRKWCFQTGQPPHPRLREALNALFVSTLPMAAYAEAAAEDPSVAEEIGLPPGPDDILDAALADMPAAEREAMEIAMDQVAHFMRQFGNPAAMFASLPPPQGGANA